MSFPRVRQHIRVVRIEQLAYEHKLLLERLDREIEEVVRMNAKMMKDLRKMMRRCDRVLQGFDYARMGCEVQERVVLSNE